MFQVSLLEPGSNNQSQNDLLYVGVSLSISLKLAPVPYATPKWPMKAVSSAPPSQRLLQR